MSKHIVNFTIGFFASLCAIFIPRMLTMLSGNGNIGYFHIDYIAVGIAFAFTIGGITVIFEQTKTKTAAETFMTALGIPALLAGALSTGTTSTQLQDTIAANHQLTETIQKQNSIAEETAGIAPLETALDSDHSRFDFSLIPSAYAQEDADAENEEGLSLGVQVEQKPYVVVLEKTNSKTDALDKAEKLRKIVPHATVVQSNQAYLVIDSVKRRNKADALLKAVDLKNNSRLNPYLLQVQ